MGEGSTVSPSKWIIITTTRLKRLGPGTPGLVQPRAGEVEVHGGPQAAELRAAEGLQAAPQSPTEVPGSDLATQRITGVAKNGYVSRPSFPNTEGI